MQMRGKSKEKQHKCGAASHEFLVQGTRISFHTLLVFHLRLGGEIRKNSWLRQRGKDHEPLGAKVRVAVVSVRVRENQLVRGGMH